MSERPQEKMTPMTTLSRPIRRILGRPSHPTGEALAPVAAPVAPEQPGVAVDIPESDPARLGPSRAAGGPGGGPPSGPTSRKVTRPSASWTHSMATHQSPSASEGRPMPAHSGRSWTRTACSRR